MKSFPLPSSEQQPALSFTDFEEQYWNFSNQNEEMFLDQTLLITENPEFMINDSYFGDSHHLPLMGDNSCSVQNQKQPNQSVNQKKRHAFTPEEDNIILQNSYNDNHIDLEAIQEKLPDRERNSIKQHWKTLISRKSKKIWTQKDDEIIISLHEQYGNQWTLISKSFNQRTHNDVKNRYQKLIKEQKMNTQQNLKA